VLFNIYYPADRTNQSTKASPSWIQNLDLIAAGIAASSNGSVDTSLVSLGLGALAGNAIIPAFTDVPIVGEGPYPVYVFSHGDTTLPEWYSHYLGSIAADGNVVVAITHRDGSNAGSQIIFNGAEPVNVTFITPDMLMPPVNATGLAMIERRFRQAEVENVVQVLQQINNGQGSEVASNNSRGDGASLGDWTGKLDFNNLVVGGHSFGATSSVSCSCTIMQNFLTCNSLTPSKTERCLVSQFVPVWFWIRKPAVLDGLVYC
jgi:platelet-activating factor acetylhydrolase